jgi:DNA-binding transcriptional regulator LsrR (DeoR family)
VAPGQDQLRPPAMGAVATSQLRLLTKVARMYHEQGIRQPQIAEQLHISQPRVSRLLKQASELGIVRVSVVTPNGVHSELEEQIERLYGVRDVVLADTQTSDSDDAVLRAVGAAAAVYLETTLTGGDRIGVSSWSATLLATVDSMRPRPTQVAEQVVQVIGGVGSSRSQAYATRLAERLALLTRAEAVFLPAPGLAATPEAREALVGDPAIRDVLSQYPRLTMVLAGIGSLEPSPLLLESGNAIADAEQDRLRRANAVGDICLHFFDERGKSVRSALDRRVLGIDVATLRSVPRVVGVAGGTRKYVAIRAALLGGWVDVLITDLSTGERLIAQEAPPRARQRVANP